MANTGQRNHQRDTTPISREHIPENLLRDSIFRAILDMVALPSSLILRRQPLERPSFV